MSPVCRPKDTNDSQYSNYVTSYACLQNGKGLPRAKTEVATGHRVQKRPSATEGSLPSQKKFHHATPQPINTDGSSQSGRRCLSPLSIPWSKNTVSVLLYRTRSLSVGANERHLSRRNLIWVPDPEGSLTKVNICTYCILKKFNSRAGWRKSATKEHLTLVCFQQDWGMDQAHSGNVLESSGISCIVKKHLVSYNFVYWK